MVLIILEKHDALCLSWTGDPLHSSRIAQLGFMVANYGVHISYYDTRGLGAVEKKQSNVS